MAKKNKLFQAKNIPNMLVVLRMILAVVIVALIITDLFVHTRDVYVIRDLFKWENQSKGLHAKYCGISVLMLIAGCLFVLASFSDFLDGYLARKYNWVSDFGKFWDPIADKVLVNSVLICFAANWIIPVWIPVIMIARDVIVDAQKMYAAKKNVVVAANIYGKMKTILQMVGLVFIFFLCQGNNYANHPAMYWGVQNFVMYAATIMSVASGVIYMVDINKKIKHANAKH